MAWRWADLSKRSASTATLGSALESMLSIPEQWRNFVCPRCSQESEYPAAVTDAPEVCSACVDDLRKLNAKAGKTRAEIMAAADVPPEYRKAFVEPDPWPRAEAFPSLDLRNWAGEPWCVLLAGIVGGGKTFLGTELLCRAAAKLGEALWLRAGSVPQLCFDRDLGSENFTRFCTVPVFLLDDLGRGHDRGAWGILIELLCQRHQYRRATIITSNRMLKRLKPTDPPGLFDEDAALARRLAAGAVIPLKQRWQRKEAA